MRIPNQVAESKEKRNTRITKYRRLKNLLKKSIEISSRCGIKINVSIYHPYYHKLDEHYTSEDFSHDDIQKLK